MTDHVLPASPRAAAETESTRLIDPRTLTLVAMIAIAAATRFIPVLTGTWNFTAVGAVCLFGGAYFSRRWAAFAVPLAAMVISDFVLFAFVYGFEHVPAMWMTYLLFALTVCLGMLLRGRLNFDTPLAATLSLGGVVGVAVLASVMFFVVSNGQYWLTSGRYPLTWAGLVLCYTLALPFAQSMFFGNLIYTPILFAGFELLCRRWPQWSLRPAELARVRA